VPLPTPGQSRVAQHDAAAARFLRAAHDQPRCWSVWRERCCCARGQRAGELTRLADDALHARRTGATMADLFIRMFFTETRPERFRHR
jgi:hypothetical protein